MDGEIISHADYLEAVYTGERSLAAMGVFLAEVREETLKNNHKRIFLDAAGAKGPYDEDERVLIAEKIMEVFRYGYKIAALEKKENINRVIENTLLTFSINFLVLADKEKALKWLLGD